MKICYIPPVKQEVSHSDVKLYSSSLPLLIAPAIIVLNNMLKITLSIGLAMVILVLIQALVKLAKSRNRDEFVSEMKRLSCAAILMWMIPYIPMFMDTISHHVGSTICSNIDILMNR